MCPTCKTTLDQSSAPIADRIRQFISARIAAGDTKSRDQAEARRPVRAGDPGRAVEARVQPAGVGAAVRRRSGWGRRRSVAGLALVARAAGARRPPPEARRSTRSSSAGSTTSSRASMAELGSGRVRRGPRSPSSRRACCRSSPATCRRSRRSRRTGWASRGIARRVVDCQPAVRRSASLSSSCCSAPLRRRSGSVLDKRAQTEFAGFLLIVIGLGFVGLLPWPERAVGTGLLAARAGIEHPAGRCVRRLRRAVHRCRAGLDPGAGRQRGLDRAGRPAARGVLDRARRGVRARRRRVHQGDVGVPLAARPLPGRSRSSAA